jgi:RES domain-containing protein
LLNDECLENLFAGDDLELTTCAGHYAHVTRYKYRNTLLSGEGAEFAAGRFHLERGAPAIYFAESPVTALIEVEALYGGDNGLIMNPRSPLMLINVHIMIPRGVLDLTDKKIRKLVDTDYQQLTGSWLLSDEVPATQRLGRVAHASRKIVAIKYPSAKWRGEELRANLVVFRDRLDMRGCGMVPYDPERDLPPIAEAIDGKRVVTD